MIYEEIREILPELKNQKRFFKINGELDLWFYDAHGHSLCSINKDVFEKVNLDGNLTDLSIDQSFKLLGFCKMIKKLQQDTVQPLGLETKCSVMINTSNRCNLNCSYCYRNKNQDDKNNLQTVKETLDYVIKRYKPNASEYVISYSMTSESSVDLKLLKEIADEYINYENYRFTVSDINDSLFSEFYAALKNDLDSKLSYPFPEKDKDDVALFLNRILEERNLFEILKMSESMFNDNDKNEIRKREILAKWRLFRLNRWSLEIKYDQFITKKRVPYVTFWFMTNGTCSKPEFIDFVKSCDINPLWISIDGPREVHDFNRKYNSGNGSYESVVSNIQVLKQNGINLKASAVITANFPKPLEIIKHLVSLGFNQIAMTPVRPGYDCSFNDQNIEELFNGYDDVFEELENTVIKNDFSLINLLREDMILALLFSFINRTRVLKRCSFDDQIVVNSKGEIYPCLYFTDNKDFCYGNIRDGIDYKKMNHNIMVSQRGSCNECWARYLCGGTCFYGSYKTTGDYTEIDPIECKIKKYLIQKCLNLIVFIKEHNISFDNII